MCTSTEVSASQKQNMNYDRSESKAKSKNSKEAEVQWDELKRARNRINSQKTREHERVQIDTLEAEKARLWLSNDAIKYQNSHMREAVAQIREVLADPSAHNRAKEKQASQAQNLALSSLRGGPRQSLGYESAAPAGLSQVAAQIQQFPQNFAGFMMANDSSSTGVLAQHAGLGLQPMVRRTLGGVLAAQNRMVHPFLLNPSPLPATTLFPAAEPRAHPETDISLYRGADFSQIGNMSNSDAM
jgi:hypothetical protein